MKSRLETEKSHNRLIMQQLEDKHIQATKTIKQKDDYIASLQAQLLQMSEKALFFEREIDHAKKSRVSSANL